MKNVLLLLLLLALPLRASASPMHGKYFDRAIFVIFENTSYPDAIRLPFFNQLALRGAHFSNFTAVTHPSQGNYIALTSGALNGVTNDDLYNLNVRNVADLLEEKGLSWKVYAEDYPGGCFTGPTRAGYARKHLPFISYLDIQKDPVRCASIVNASQFEQDAKNGTLPDYAFYVPSIRDDGHDTGAVFADKWYQAKFTPYLNTPRFMENTVLISTFDEGGKGPQNQVYTSIVGPAVRPQTVSTPLNHYSLLRLIEENWGLNSLGKFDSAAQPVPNIWQ